MKSIIVGIAGGVASGKNLFAKKLVSILAEKKMKALPVQVQSSRDLLDEPSSTADCVIYHGLTVLEDPRLREILDVKVFLDVDADIRLSNLIKRGKYDVEMVDKYDDVRSFHLDYVMKQKKLADIWINEITSEKLDDVVGVIEKIRREPKKLESEPVEVCVYLEKYNQIIQRTRGS